MLHPFRTSALALGLVLIAIASCQAPGPRTEPTGPAEPPPAPAEAPPRPLAPTLPGPPIYALDEQQVGELLATVRFASPELPHRVISIARKFLGQPYRIYLLGEYPYECYDPDPIYCLTHSDCVTFCEMVYAMSMSQDWWGYLRTLQRLRYKDGVIGMLTRNHYTTADWDINNGFVFEDLTRTLGQGRVAKPMAETIDRAAFFRKFGLGQDIPVQHHDDAYIPVDRVPLILGELRDGDFVNIIRGTEPNLWAGHTGLIAIDADNNVDFLHSATPAVREQPLMDYLQHDKRCVGIKILRLRPDAQANMTAAIAAPQCTPVSETIIKERLAASPLMSTGQPRWYAEDWMEALRLQSFELDFATPIDPRLQEKLETADQRIAAELGIPPEDRSIGVLDLRHQRYAAYQPDALFYGASVPKIGIALAYFEKNPDAATNLDPTVRRELEKVLKESDNELAAKYSQLLGLDYIQSVLQSPRYQFWDKNHGGGIWCGKHYGVAEPRYGDPIGDHSHAVTVRQCLRYFLMLEQGKLVSAAASATMKRLFAAPSLEFTDHNFISGLKGRHAVVIRKSGLWEDWHLDVARVVCQDRCYLIAGATHHPKGGEYLARMAAAIDDLLGATPVTAPQQHKTIIHDSAADFLKGDMLGGRISPDGKCVLLAPPDADSEAWYESPIITRDVPFNEALLSVNVDTPDGGGMRAELRVGNRRDDSWSPWMFIIDWGTNPPAGERVLSFDRGNIKVDFFKSTEHFDRVQYRIRAVRKDPQAGDVRVRRVALTLSETTGAPVSILEAEPHLPPPDPALVHRRLDVPFRTQRTDDPNLSGQLCSPTSVSMVVSYRGVNTTTNEMYPVVRDPWNHIFGNWPRNVQAAYTFGVGGYLTRFSRWEDVERMIAAGQPLILSIVAKEPGALRHTRYKTTDGHLIVLTGFDADGRVCINDPASPTEEEGLIMLDRDELEAVWLRGTGGVAYVLLPRE